MRLSGTSQCPCTVANLAIPIRLHPKDASGVPPTSPCLLRLNPRSKDPERPNLVATVGDPEGLLLFLIVAHSDTVAIGDPSLWSHPPLGAETDGDRLWGRGACDNKAGIAVGLYTLLRLQVSTARTSI